MNLYLVHRLPNQTIEWDMFRGFVVRAINEQHAREIANDHSAFDDDGYFLTPEMSSCELLTGDGEQGIILSDFKAG